MTPLYGAANPTDTRQSRLSSAGGPHAKSVCRRTLAGRFIAIRPISACGGQVAKVRRGAGGFRGRRLNHQRRQQVSRLLAVLALAPVITAPKGMPRPSVAKWTLVPDLPRSTGLGPVG